MSIASDNLLAVTGIFPGEITPREHSASTAVQERWTRRLTHWVRTPEAKPFKFAEPKKNLDAVFLVLAKPISEQDVAGYLDGIGVDDSLELGAEYYAAMVRARDYVVNAWPKFSLEGPAGLRILPLSHDDKAEVWSIIQVLDDPDRVLDEMDSQTLTDTQALAFRECYPDLYALADTIITSEIIERRAKNEDWELGVAREAMLNTLRGLPPEERFTPPPPPPAPGGKFKLDPERTKTQIDISSAPKART